MSETRARVLECVRRFPGIHLRGIERELGISSALVHYHVKALESAGDVVSAAIGGYLRFYPHDLGEGRGLAPADADVLAAIREPVPFQIVLLLLEGGPLAQSELVEELALAKSTVSYHVDKLEERRVVARTQDAKGERVVKLRDGPRLRRLLVKYVPTADLQDRFRSLWEDFYG